jgi:hypothetical protein
LVCADDVITLNENIMKNKETLSDVRIKVALEESAEKNT